MPTVTDVPAVMEAELLAARPAWATDEYIDTKMGEAIWTRVVWHGDDDDQLAYIRTDQHTTDGLEIGVPYLVWVGLPKPHQFEAFHAAMGELIELGRVIEGDARE